jgi:signal transduction histidine kinase
VSNAGPIESPGKRLDRLEAEVLGLRQSRKRLVEAADADRRAIERAVHDGIQQSLVAIAVELRRVSGMLDRDPAAARALLAELAANVGQALAETAELAQSIYPPMLEARGLASALRSAAESAGVTLVVDVPAGAAYPAGITAALYWSCLEALSSASPGSQAAISVRDADGILTFEIAIAGPLADGGLDRLHDRIEALDGGVRLEPGNDGGSQIHGSLALSR